MKLLPESIQTNSTVALDATWATRLALLRFELLKIDITTETDARKLEMWLEMFGVSMSSIPDNLSAAEYQRLLRYIILIFRLSGTRRAIELICQVLGATEVEIIQDFTLYYNGEFFYSGVYYYDSGAHHRPFVVRLKVTGIGSGTFAAFEAKLRRLFEIFEPVWIHLKKVEIAGDGFPMTFPFTLAGTGEFPMTFPLILGEASRFPVVFPVVFV